MRLSIVAMVLCVGLAGCAEQSLLKQEQAVLDRSVISSTSNLKTMGIHSASLSVAYRQAAREATRGQDAAAVITYLAAAGFVSGAVGAASDTALANRGFVGVASSSLAGRTVSGTTIKGIYIASKRMNCVSTVARMGGFLLDGSSRATKGMARAATYGAIEEVKIITRQALVREVAQFTTLRDNLLAGITLSEEQINGLRNLREEGGPDVDFVSLNQYLGLLDNCLADAATLTAVEKLETD